MLKDKQDRLSSIFIEHIKKNMELRTEIEQLLSETMQNVLQAEAHMGTNSLYEALMMPSNAIYAEMSSERLMNIELPKISISVDREESPVSYGLSSSCEELDKAVVAIKSVIPKLIQLAEAEKISAVLSSELERIRRRTNALDYILIPQMKNTIKNITMKLEENERNNLVRLMKVKDIALDDQNNLK